MTIDIHKSELANLIQQGMEDGNFANVEDMLIEALRTATLPKSSNQPHSDRTGADLIEAMQAMPFRDTDIEPSRPHQPVRDVTL